MALIEIGGIESRKSTGRWHRLLDNLRIFDQSRIGVIGGCDSGKTALACFLAGIGSDSFVRGTMHLDGSDIRDFSHRERARRIALVPTDPSHIFSGMRATVRGEMELSLQWVGYGPEEKCRVDDWIGMLRLDHLSDRDPFTLSGGEQVRAAVALAVVKNPQIIILDDVFSALDSEAVGVVREALTRVHQMGSTVIELHSSSPAWISAFDTCAYLLPNETIQGRYQDVSAAVAEAAGYLVPKPSGEKTDYAPARQQSASICDLCSAADHSPALSTSEWLFRYQSGNFQLGPLSLSLPRGQATAILGPNGSGKTTLLRTIALLLRAQSGDLWVKMPDGRIIRRPDNGHRHLWARYVLYAFQNPDDQIYLPTVRRELTETARIVGHANFKDIAENIAFQLDLSDWLECPPADLPRPMRRLTTIASCFIARPPVVLLDEPSAGLDQQQKEKLGRVIFEYINHGGTAAMVSHDQNFISSVCNNRLSMDRGCIFGTGEWDLHTPYSPGRAKLSI